MTQYRAPSRFRVTTVGDNGHDKPTPIRQPPHSEPAEASLLGAMLITRDAYDAALGVVTADDFYRPAHGHIFDAIDTMYRAGEAVDPVTVAEHLGHRGLIDAIGDISILTTLQVNTPAIGSAARYAAIVAEHAWFRRIIGAGAELTETGYARDRDAAIRLTGRLLEAVDPGEPKLDPDLDEFLATEDEPYDWVIPDVAEAGDRILITGPEGGGKSTLLRQLVVQAATGVHPFTGDPIDPVAGMLVDCENSQRHVRRKLAPLRELAGDSYQPGRLRVSVVGHSLDLTRDAVYSDLARRVDAHQPRLIVIGPLYKMGDGDPTKEEPARDLADNLDRLRAISGAALFIEAHTPYGDGTKARRPIRPYGASLWSRWPEFGVYLGPEGELEHWRGQRDERAWPSRLARSQPWPWMATSAPVATTWDGPTECMAAVERYITDRPDEEFTGRSLDTKLRAHGLGYRHRTIAEALERLAADGRIGYRRGPRNSDLYRALTAPRGAVDDCLDF